MTNEKSEYGVITEQGDLGLGFEPLTEKEAEPYKKKQDKMDKKKLKPEKEK